MTGPTHTIHIDSWHYGPTARLECDDSTACETASQGGCHLQTWWIELGTELIDNSALTGPPPWKVQTVWFGDPPAPQLSAVDQ